MNNKRIKEDISTCFKNGLWEKYEMKIEDLNNWKYSGGDKGRHKNYWKLVFGKLELPEKEDKCVCGHKIKENCYITNKENTELIVIGNCCIKRFMKNSGKTCEECGKPHKNRLVNKCNDCRGCLRCGKECSPYKYCTECFKI